MNENDFKTSWVAVAVVALVAFIAGFIVGLVCMGNSDFHITGFIIIIAFAVVIRGAMRILIAYEAAHVEELHKARSEEMELLNKRQNMEQLELKRMRLINETAKSDAKADARNYTFTSNDFDDAAQSLLLKPVKESRKKKLRVTGQGLIESILKGIR